jgi:hypothetical protein
MRELSGDALLALPVRLHGIQLGRPADLLLDRESFRAVGLDVVCSDEVHRFLPLPTAVVSEEEIVIRSPFVLLEESQRDFYRARAFTLTSLRGRVVQRERREAGKLRDVVLGPAWELVAVIVESEGRTRRVAFDGTIRFAPESRSAA